MRLHPPSRALRLIPWLAGLSAAVTMGMAEPTPPPPLPPAADTQDALTMARGKVAEGWRTFYDRSPGEALPPFQEAVRLAPDLAEAHYGLGRALLATSPLEEARASLERACSLEPSQPEYAFYLGVTAYQEEHFDEALALWLPLEATMSALPPGPLPRDYAWLMARALEAEGDLVRAEAAFALAFERGGIEPSGRLRPPPPSLERTAFGRIPGDALLPLPSVQGLTREQSLLLQYNGALWRLEGGKAIARRALPHSLLEAFPAPHPSDGSLAFLGQVPDASLHLLLLTPQGEVKKPLATPVLPVRPAFSPDGSSLAFVAQGGDPRRPMLHILQLSDARVDRIDWPSAPVTGVTWLSLEQLGVSCVDPSGRGVLVTVTRNMPGSTPLELTPLETEERREPVPEVAPQRLRKDSRGVLEPWETQGPAAAPSQAMAPPVQASSAPSLSPRSGFRVEVGKTAPGERGAGGLEALPSRQEPCALPGPGKRLISVELAQGRRRLRLDDLEARDAVALTPKEADCHAPAVSVDGRFLVYLCREGDLERVFIRALPEGRPLEGRPLEGNPIEVSPGLSGVEAVVWQ